ncbi:MAG TPA: T9SS type A sorting domain-containing protein, partial [Phaeodactylibacter sp.]|nr:T9SS type A sorting domain-containing protein [Phaeodactylibacter sp.]
DGVYNVCLSVWDDQGCLSTFCSDVIVGDLSDICNLTDCVFPGDANKDGSANFYDLLELGIGNGITGPERPYATTEWTGQLAPDWAESTLDGINFKHLDCDGNGVIDENDAVAITDNYQVMDAPNPTTEASAPLIYIEFDQDTIFVDDNLLASDIEITAHLKVGNQNFPAQNIYGLAMYLSYPSDLVYEDSVSFEYDTNSFFGSSNEVFWMPNNQYDEEQIDIGVTRKDATASSGFGEIGKTVFIIDADILDGRAENGDVHFPVSVNGVKMIDADGNELPINLTNTPATLVFTKAPETTGANNPQLAQEIQVFPNPASEKINIDLGNLNGIQLQVFNNFGQILLKKNIPTSNTELNVKDWNTGVYFVKIKTEEGVVSKRLVLK